MYTCVYIGTHAWRCLPLSLRAHTSTHVSGHCCSGHHVLPPPPHTHPPTHPHTHVHVHPQVVEYRGDVLRPSLADMRERRYAVEGRDCYLFRATEHGVIDSTTLGNVARFTNHSCAPSLYTKVSAPRPPLPLLLLAF